ncbi:MAG: glycosyltransferase family 4 protein [Candidatus Aenigmarchaeota archaeon]|nr:glycosyltransferase family 4 protein [Candidatus Aenigmarchaeota archaeon]
MESLKIAILTSSFSQGGLLGGVTKTVRLIARELSKKGHDVTVFSFKFPGMTSFEHLDGFTVRRFMYNEILGEWCYSLSMLNCIKKLSFDLVHSHHYPYYPATIGYKVAQYEEIPHIFTPHFHPFQSNIKKIILSYFYRKTFGEKILKNSDAVLPQNENEKNELLKIVKRKYEIVPAPIDEKIFSKYTFRKNNNKVILYVGAMIKDKAGIAFEICNNIAKMHENISFVFVGNGPLLQELKKRAGKNFTFLKNLTDKKLALQYNKADILLHPTKYESFSRVIAEACMCGLPSVSVNTGAIPETQLGCGRLVEWGNWGSMEEEVLNLLKSDKKRKKLGMIGLKKSKIYHSDEVNKKLYKIYKKVLI